MAFQIRRVEYFQGTVSDKPEGAYGLLSELEKAGINLLAVTAAPVGPLHTHLTLFPEDALQMADAARKSGLVLDGPHPALLVQGDDELGALAEIHGKLARADVNVYASSGVSGGDGSFGYVLYIRPEKFEQAVTALGV